jgi:predicted ATP-grasp superfamily ATP-dependent carboligase
MSRPQATAIRQTLGVSEEQWREIETVTATILRECRLLPSSPEAVVEEIATPKRLHPDRLNDAIAQVLLENMELIVVASNFVVLPPYKPKTNRSTDTIHHRDRHCKLQKSRPKKCECAETQNPR